MDMNLVKVENKQIVTDSRQIAENFGKRHDHVLRDITNLKEDLPNFGEMFMDSVLPDAYGREQKVYLMNRDGFTLLAMGFTGKKALEWKLKYINAFNEMEARLKEQEVAKLKAIAEQDSYRIEDPVARALRWAEEAKERQALLLTNRQQQQVIGELKPKADYVDNILRSKSLVTITQIAKDYGMSGQAMNAKLHELGIQYKAGNQWLLYSKYHACSYTSSKTVEIMRKDGTSDVVMNTCWTQKGRLFLYEKLKKADILPLIEQISELPLAN